MCFSPAYSYTVVYMAENEVRTKISEPPDPKMSGENEHC
jgi:hypothetical protein